MQNEENINSDNYPTPFHNQSFDESDEEAISPNNPPFNALFAFLLWLASVLAIGIVPLIFLVPYLLSQNVQIADAKALAHAAANDPNAILIQIGAIIPAHLLTLLLAWAIVTNFKTYPFLKTLGWSMGNFKWWNFPIVLGLFFVFAAAVSIFFPEQETELTKILASSRYAVILVALIATFSAPIVEEVVYRGVIYSAFQKNFNIPVAVLVTTTLFAGVHFLQYWGSPGTLILITVLSLILTLVRVQTNNLLPCVVLHFIFNGIQSAAMILEPYLKQAAPIEPVPAFLQFLLK